MADYQMSLIDTTEADNKREAERKKRRTFLDGWQKWCNEMYEDDTTSYGKCGYGWICNYCAGSDVTNPCRKTLVDYAIGSRTAIPYESSYEDIWNGRFKRK